MIVLRSYDLGTRLDDDATHDLALGLCKRYDACQRKLKVSGRLQCPRTAISTAVRPARLIAGGSSAAIPSAVAVLPCEARGGGADGGAAAPVGERADLLLPDLAELRLG